MCGICGFQGFEDKKLIKKMCSVLTHRGPDDEGFFFDKNVNLGIRRLSIIDIKGGHQPVHNENETVWIVFNGEIYNYLNLRSELENKGHKFYTKSDTEVIVHCYEEFGYDFVKKLRGVFSFAIWDSEKKRLIIARDRIGITPLYYLKIGNKFFFASEVKSILQYKEFKREVDTEALHFYLTFQYVPSPMTILKGIKKLKPGHMIIWEEGDYNVLKYWDVESDVTDFPEDYYSKRLLELLKESIRMRLVGEVPLGLYLSGGLDSSSITALVSKMINEPVKTFSIGNDYESVDELKYARIVSEKFGTDHNEIIVNSDDIIKNIFNIFWHVDEPIADSAVIPEFFLSKKAKERVTVILSGGGSDELFGGYNNYKNVIFFEKMRRNVPHTIRRLLPKTVNLISKKPSHINYAKYISSKENYPVHYKTQGYLFYYEKDMLYNDNLKTLTREKDSMEIVKEYYYYNTFKNYPKDIFDRLSYVDLKMFVPDNCLAHQEKTGYAHSVEIRAPFLDHHIVEFAFTVPTKFKMVGSDFKYILKKTMKNYLPKEILERKKMGFPAPTNLWFSRGELKDFAINTIEQSEIINNYFNINFINDLFKKSDMTKAAHQIWGLLVLSVWYKIFLENYKVKI